MNITERYKGHSGVEYIFEYSDADSFDHLDYDLCKQAYAVCFYEDTIVIGYAETKKLWALIGGKIENGETFDQTLIREIKEESNMEVLQFLPIGYQKMIDTRDNTFIYQLRYVCTVRPYGPFVIDSAEGLDGITEIKIINPKDYKQYFDWGKIGEHIMERAIELKNKL